MINTKQIGILKIGATIVGTGTQNAIFSHYEWIECNF